MQGVIICSQSGFHTVETADGQLFTCQLRGRLKKGPRRGDVTAVGDNVRVTTIEAGIGVIEEVLPRKREFFRQAPTPKGEYQQIIIANLDQAVLVFACTKPTPRFGMLDRFLVICEKQEIPVSIVVNKIDLTGISEAKKLFDNYSQIGYGVFYTSALTTEGVNELKEHLINKISLFIGPSGVGKSSLLNEIQPGLGLSVRQVSRATSKGRHATVVREMFPIDGGGYVADTPGLKALALWDMEPEEVDGYFLEFRPLVEHCQFSNCTHIHEPGCAVLAAVKSGEMNQNRYASYVRMRSSLEEDN